MTITKNTIVTLKYHVTDEEGHMIDEGHEPLRYLHGGYENIFEPIEKALEGKSVGDSFKVALSAHESFGEYNSDLVMVESLDNLPENLQVGMQIEGHPQGDEENAILYVVTDIKEDRAFLDGNHPLAGINIIFDGSITHMRMATDEEIQKNQILID